ncbi:hypothetical protein SLS59_000260 [Nothophoma quercina]|uniref:Uncharacterized protein n=1 Tax=Nothophoma quercina TaxID=749835 RepID=A0ABR3S4D2_9PLEO
MWKGGGLDLERLKREKRFGFVDGLSGLVLGEQQPQTQGRATTAISQAQPQIQPQTQPQTALPQRTGNILPVRGPPGRTPIPTRGPPAPPAQPAHPATSRISPSTTLQTNASSVTSGYYTLTSLDLAHLKSTLTTAITSLASTPQRKTLLVLDTPDLPLALSSTTPPDLVSLVLTLHNTLSISHILAHLQADTPLLTPSQPAQPLEIAQYNFLTKMAHMSTRILGTRVLDTGVARDVSGVVRVTEQRVGWTGLGFEEEDTKLAADDSGKGKEFLYQVKGDGSVKVFERGAGEG